MKEGIKELSEASLKDTIPSGELTLMSSSPAKGLTSNTLGVRVSTWEFGGYTVGP